MFDACEQPDELLLLAWNAGLDRKAVIAEGSDAARLLVTRSDVVDLFLPLPGPLEAVDRWADNPSSVTALTASVRPFASAVVPGCIVGALVSHFFVAPHLSEQAGLVALVLIIIAMHGVIGLAFKVVIERTLSHRVAQLDEDRALAIVLVLLRRGIAARAALVPYVMKSMRRGLAARTRAQSIRA